MKIELSKIRCGKCLCLEFASIGFQVHAINRRAWLVALFFLWAVHSGGAAEKTQSPWNRIVLIGASATAGFTASEVFGGTNTAKCRLSRYVDAAIAVPHEPVENLAQPFFFMQPEELAIQTRERRNKPDDGIFLEFLRG